MSLSSAQAAKGRWAGRTPSFSECSLGQSPHMLQRAANRGVRGVRSAIVFPPLGAAGCSRCVSCSCSWSGPPSNPHPTRLAESNGPKHISTQAFSSPYLPLPPQLPYTPDSVPFKRHLAVLETALLSSRSDDSWKVFKALHPSLHRYLPRPLVRTLFDKQAESPRAAWNRCRRIWLRGREGELPAHALATDHLQALLCLGIAATRAQRPTIELRSDLDAIWLALDQAIGIKHLRLETRRQWLSYQGLLRGRDEQHKVLPDLDTARILANAEAGADLAVGIERIVEEVATSGSQLGHILWFAQRRVIFSTRAFQQSLLAAMEDASLGYRASASLEYEISAVCQTLREQGQASLADQWTAIAARIAAPEALEVQRKASSSKLVARLRNWQKESHILRKAASERETLRDVLLVGIKLVGLAQTAEVDIPLDIYNSLVVEMLSVVKQQPVKADAVLPVAKLWLEAKHKLEATYPVTAANLLRQLVWSEDPARARPLAATLYNRTRAQEAAQRFTWGIADVAAFKRFMVACLRRGGDLPLAARLYSDWLAAGLQLPAHTFENCLKRFSVDRDVTWTAMVERLLSEAVDWDIGVDAHLATIVVDGAVMKGDAEHLQVVFQLLAEAMPDIPSTVVAAVLDAISRHDEPDWRFAAQLVSQLLASGSRIADSAQEAFFTVVIGEVDAATPDITARYRAALAVYHALLDRGQAPTKFAVDRVAFLQSLSEGPGAAEQTRKAALAAGIQFDSLVLAKGRVDHPGCLLQTA